VVYMEASRFVGKGHYRGRITNVMMLRSAAFDASCLFVVPSSCDLLSLVSGPEKMPSARLKAVSWGRWSRQSGRQRKHPKHCRTVGLATSGPQRSVRRLSETSYSR